MPLTPDKTTTVNGVTLKEYLLTNHNPNRIAMPSSKLPSKPYGITVHNTQSISVSGTTMSEQYTRATVNGNMNDVRVHFYVDDKEAWQNLPLTLAGWHAADGMGKGNMQTIAIECIMDGQTGARNEAAEKNCAKLVAWLLDKYSLTTNDVYSHNHWYSRKYCPLYILPHWNSFITLVESFRAKANTGTTNQPTGTMYRVRKSWDDVSSQIGAYRNLEAAKAICTDGYFVFDEKGTKVFPLEDVTNKYPTSSVEVPTLRKGAKGIQVKKLQVLLQVLGYNLGSYGVDGDFGTTTETAVKKLQTDNKLAVDGIVGNNTWSVILK